MKLYFYRGKSPNFGDELNQYLLPKIFPGMFDGDGSTIFLGIGSVLFDFHPQHATKVVFGSGFGGYTPPPRIDSSWDIFCVRGLHTARVLGISPRYCAGDSAILINRELKEKPLKRYRHSFIPHWESLARGQWPQVCQETGVHLIDPTLPVLDVLAEIQASEVVITEAMHGAIVSDALRVPWIPVLPFDRKHHFKWHDWASALELTLRPAAIPASSLREQLAVLGRSGTFIENLPGPAQRVIKVVEQYMAARSAATLRRLTTVEPSLSSESALQVALEKLEHSAENLGRKYGIKAFSSAAP